MKRCIKAAHTAPQVGLKLLPEVTAIKLKEKLKQQTYQGYRENFIDIFIAKLLDIRQGF